MSKSRRERQMLKIYNPEWVLAKEFIENFVFDDKFEHTVYFIQEGKRKQESFRFHDIIKSEAISVDGDIDIITYTFVEYKIDYTPEFKSIVTNEIKLPTKIIDILDIEYVSSKERFNPDTAIKIKY